MLMTEIKRERVGTIVVEPNLAIANIAAMAKSLLGYEVLAKRIEKSGPVVSEESELRGVLEALEIEILNVTDVLRYQKERLIERTAELMQEWMEKTAKRTLNNFEETFFDSFSGPNWHWQAIKEYQQPIPQFVLAKAVQIKERLPGCELYVESLEDHPDPFLFVGAPKPQYRWQKPKEFYYVECWAEPKFEGMLRQRQGQAASGEEGIPF